MRKVWHRLKTYLRLDFREIVNPTSLPNPPEYVPPKKQSWEETWKVRTSTTDCQGHLSNVREFLAVVYF